MSRYSFNNDKNTKPPIGESFLYLAFLFLFYLNIGTLLSFCFSAAGVFLAIKGIVWLVRKANEASQRYQTERLVEQKKRENELREKQLELKRKQEEEMQKSWRGLAFGTHPDDAPGQKQFTVYGMKIRPRTGDAELDKLLDKEEHAINKMLRLDIVIEDPQVSAQIVHLQEVTSKITDCLMTSPDKIPLAKKFFDYYIPTTLHLLDQYDKLEDAKASGENIDGSKEEIEKLLKVALAGYDKELDLLYGKEAIDATAEIKTLRSMLMQDGLVEDDLQKMLNSHYTDT